MKINIFLIFRTFSKFVLPVPIYGLNTVYLLLYLCSGMLLCPICDSELFPLLLVVGYFNKSGIPYVDYTCIALL